MTRSSYGIAVLFALLGLTNGALAQDTTRFTNARFIDQEGRLFDLSSAPLPGASIGDLRADFTFTSTLIDPDNDGQFVVTPMIGFWSIEDEVGARVPSWEGDPWFGDFTVQAPTMITSFDPDTGQGSGVVSIPIARGIDNGQRFPRLPAGASTLHVALGSPEAMHVGAAGEVQGASLLGALPVSVGLPDVWVDLFSPLVSPGSVELAAIHSSASIDTARTYTIEIPLTRQACFLENGSETHRITFTMEPDVIAVYVEVRALAEGPLHVVVLDDQGTEVARSASGEVVVGFSVSEEEALLPNGYYRPGVTVGGSIPDGPHVETDPVEPGKGPPLGVSTHATGIRDLALDTGLKRVCKHPKSGDYDSHRRICSKCSENPTIPDCAEGRCYFWYTPACCEYRFFSWSFCHSNGYTTIETPLYGPTEKSPYETRNGCPSKSDSLSILWGGIEANEGAVTQTSKFCCEYVEKGPTHSLSLRDCNSK